MNVIQIARVCHDANKALCESIGDYSQRPWHEADKWQKDASIAGVEHFLSHPDATAATIHDVWVDEKLKGGWKLGPVKNAVLKTHPSMVPFGDLPLTERLKDSLFRAVVAAFIEAGE